MWVASGAVERDSIGSADALQVGDRCLTLDETETDVCESVDGADSSTWSRKRLANFKWGFNPTGATTLAFVPFGDISESGSGGVAGTVLIPSFDGRLVRASVNCNVGTMGVTAVAGQVEGSGPVAAELTVDIDTADKGYGFTWASLTFSAGEQVEMSVDPTGAAGTAMWGILTLELDYTQQLINP